MGLAVWVPLGLVAEFGVPALVTPPGYHGVLPLAARATILVLQALPLTVGLIAGTSLVRRGRLGLGWFLIVTGICATAPAAACEHWRMRCCRVRKWGMIMSSSPVP